MHVKMWKVEEFFDTKGKLLFTKKIKEREGKEKWVQEEGDQENKKVKQKRKSGDYETWWTKTRSDEKRTEEKTCKKEKHTKKTKEIQFFKYGRVLEKNRIKRRQN